VGFSLALLPALGYADLASIKAHCMIHKARSDAAHEKMDKLTAESKSLKCEQKAIAEYHNDVDKIFADKARLDKEIKALTAEIAKLKGILDKLAPEVKKHKDAMAKIQADEDKIFADLAKFAAAKDASKIGEAQKALDKLKVDKAKLEAQGKALLADEAAKAGIQKKLNADIEKLKADQTKVLADEKKINTERAELHGNMVQCRQIHALQRRWAQQAEAMMKENEKEYQECQIKARDYAKHLLEEIKLDYARIFRTQQACVKLYKMIKGERLKVAELNKRMRGLKTCSANVWKTFDAEKAKFIALQKQLSGDPLIKCNMTGAVDKLKGDLNRCNVLRQQTTAAKKFFNGLIVKNAKQLATCKAKVRAYKQEVYADIKDLFQGWFAPVAAPTPKQTPPKK
jgi:chromosome segregation ATPase